MNSATLTSRCSTVPLRCTGQFLSRGFVVLLRKRFPQKISLRTAAELNVMHYGEYEFYMCNEETYERIIKQIEYIMADVPPADKWKWRNRGYEELRFLISNIPYMDIKKYFESKKWQIRAEEIFHLAIAGCKDCKDELNRIVEHSNDVDDVFTAALGLAALNEPNAYSTLDKLCSGEHRIKADDVFDQLDCYIQHINHPSALVLEKLYIGNKSFYPRPENA